MRRRTILLALLLAFVAAGTARGQSLLMARSHLSFPETMLALQGAIGEHGYKVSRVQRVDIGLTASGYETDKYRIVFFGKPEQVRDLSRRYPQLIPYLPQKITIFAEAEDTLVVALDPSFYAALVNEPGAHAIFDQWRVDLESIMAQLGGLD
jgi:uncharacterized protein (DUF302 family)